MGGFILGAFFTENNNFINNQQNVENISHCNVQKINSEQTVIEKNHQNLKL